VQASADSVAERALLVQVFLPNGPAETELEEFRFLAESAGAQIAGTITTRRAKPVPATFIGSGKVEELADQVREEKIDLLLFNHELSPIQVRNLERALKCRVLDRTELILDIFALRARSHEGKLQVELAQLERLATRLVRGWTHLERQKGGIGLRGPGETQLETDRRLMRDRIRSLNKRLQKVRTQRGLRRKTRNKIPIPTVSLVGYTNAGKSTLFNRLTGAEVYAADQLFATLDPTMRRLNLDGRLSVILTDTVGFIRDLPHGLVEAFKSTLEEVAQADLLLHVVDLQSPEKDACMLQVDKVLQEIGADTVPTILVFNKIDAEGLAPRIERNEDGMISRIWLSAATGEGVDLLMQALEEYYQRFRQCYHLVLPVDAGRLRAAIYNRLQVESEQVQSDGSSFFELWLDDRELAWLKNQPDFDVDTIQPMQASELAPTGSYP
jgi:GTP-binding protein HflX